MRKRDISDTNASDNFKIKKSETRERFLYHFFSELLDRDVEILRIYEQRLMEMEENILEGKAESFHEKIRKHKEKRHPKRCLFFGDSYGNRTHDSAVRGQRLSLLTKEPQHW